MATRRLAQPEIQVQKEIEGIVQATRNGAKGKSPQDQMIANNQIAQVQQGMQDPAQMEKLISMQMEKLMAEILPQLAGQQQDPMNDPLVQIRMKELAIKEQDLQRKKEDDQSDVMIELQKLQQRAATDAARIELQEEVAEDRNEVNRERINVQRQAMQRRNK